MIDVLSSHAQRLPALIFVLLQLALTLPVQAQEERRTSFPTLKLIGFFDVTAFAASGGDADAADAGVDSAELDLVVLARLSRRLSFLGDVSVAGQRRTPRDSTPDEVEATLERAILRYEIGDPLRLLAGQMHTPLSRWSEVYHRGRWLHVAASRPLMVEFDGRFLPVRFLGAKVEGTTWANGWNLSYHAGVGDGRPDLTTADDARMPESDGAAFFGLAVEPARSHGFRAGATVYSDRLTLPAAGTKVDETILSAHLSWTRGINQVIGELSSIRHRDDASGRSFDSEGFYLEIAYQLPFLRRRMTLYNRVEELRVEAGDPVLRATGARASMIGLRFDVHEQAAVKAELRQDTARNRRDSLGLFLQASLTF